MQPDKVFSYKDLIVYQKSVTLTLKIYEFVKLLPKDESNNLVSQMKRNSVSIASNIVEGYSKGSRNNYRNFLKIAFSSAAELESQLELVNKLNLLRLRDDELLKEVVELLTEVLKMLTTMIKNVS